MKNTTLSLKVYFGLLLATLFWGLSFIGTKFLLSILNPITLVLIRLIISVVFLLVLGKLLGFLDKVKRKHWKWFFVLAFFEPFLYFIGETYGLMYVSATIASIIISTIPLFVPWGGWFFFKEKVGWKNFLGILISVVGVIITMLNKNMEFAASLVGIALVGIAVVSAVAYTLIIRYIAYDYSALSIITYQNLLGLPFFIILFLLVDLPNFSIEKITIELWGVLLLMGIFPSSLAYLFYTYAVREIGVTKTSVFVNLIPVITAVASFLLFGEELTLIKGIGILVVLSGLYLSQSKIKKIKAID